MAKAVVVKNLYVPQGGRNLIQLSDQKTELKIFQMPKNVQVQNLFRENPRKNIY